MTLAQIRANFVAKTGRNDLVAGDGTTDDGANFFINAGLRLLDTLQDNPYTKRRYMKDVVSGAYTLSFQYCRSVEKVWMSNANQRYELTGPMSEEWIRRNYEVAIADIATGVPVYYCTNVIKLAPSQIDETLVGFTDATYDKGDIVYGRDWTYTGILFMPPADGTYTATVYGKFFTERLAEDANTNYWSNEYPDLLVMAAMAELELFNRNREGFLDIVEGLKNGLNAVDFILVEQEIAGESTMGRSG